MSNHRIKLLGQEQSPWSVRSPHSLTATAAVYSMFWELFDCLNGLLNTLQRQSHEVLHRALLYKLWRNKSNYNKLTNLERNNCLNLRQFTWNLNIARIDYRIQFLKASHVSYLWFDCWSHKGTKPPCQHLQLKTLRILISYTWPNVVGMS